MRFMVLRRSKRSRLGLESIVFETFGYGPEADDSATRRWLGDSVLITEDFFSIPSDLPSLDVETLRNTYEEQLVGLATARREPRIIELDVQQNGVVPIVRLLLRVPLEDRYAFVGSLTMPVAEASWVVKVMAREGPITGVREAVAFARYSAEHPDRSPGSVHVEDFDPYDARWDSDATDPLTAVRTHLRRIQETVTVRPEVEHEAPFRP
jgi:hypothetical protein